MQRKKRKYKIAPPPPQNGGDYILVNTKEGPHWRRKRGTVKKARLNDAFRENAAAMAVASPAAKKIFDKLQPYLSGLNTGRFIANVSSKLTKSLVTSGELNFSFLEGYDLQPDWPFSSILRSACTVTERPDELIIEIPVDQFTIKVNSRLVTGYYFDAILLYGDLRKKNGLKTESETSPLYPVDERFKAKCRLSLILPAKNIHWILLVKLSCLEGNSPAVHPKYYAMKMMKVKK
jgi:hypothetical protein